MDPHDRRFGVRPHAFVPCPRGVVRLAVSRNEGGLFGGERHSPRIPSSIKNQSVEIEDD